MDRGTIWKLEEKIGNVEEIETDEASKCIGQLARAKISIDITQLLKKVMFLQQGVKIPMPIL